MKARAFLELARLSNLPTVAGNVLVGLAAGAAATGDRQTWDTLLLERGGLLIAAAVGCFYVMGMVLNDIADRHVDAVERPERPLPSQRVTLRTATTLAVLLTAAGCALLAMTGNERTFLWGATLVAAIVGYNLLHKRFVWAIVLMGLCRALVYALAASTSAAAHEMRWWAMVSLFAGIMGVYTVALTLIARMENESALGRRRWAAVMMMPLALAAVVMVRPTGMDALWTVVAAVALLMWLARGAAHIFVQPPRTKVAVLMWIAGMCLVDAYFLTLLGEPTAALATGGCFGLTVWAHRHIMGT